MRVQNEYEIVVFLRFLELPTMISLRFTYELFSFWYFKLVKLEIKKFWVAKNI